MWILIVLGGLILTLALALVLARIIEGAEKPPLWPEDYYEE
jgi:hypothetical protein